MPDREFILRNSIIRLERGAAGTLARIERASGVDWAGPVPEETIDAIREVSAR